MPVATLATRLGISRTTAQARLERLERIGVIAGYGLRLSEAYASSLVRAHVLITIAPKSLHPVTAAIGRVEAVAGGPVRARRRGEVRGSRSGRRRRSRD